MSRHTLGSSRHGVLRLDRPRCNRQRRKPHGLRRQQSFEARTRRKVRSVRIASPPTTDAVFRGEVKFGDVLGVKLLVQKITSLSADPARWFFRSRASAAQYVVRYLLARQEHAASHSGPNLGPFHPVFDSSFLGSANPVEVSRRQGRRG